MKHAGLIPMLCAVAAMAAAPAWAHAFPQSEQPLVGSTVTSPPKQVAITYDAPIVAAFSKLAVLDQSGHSVTAGPPAVTNKRRTLSVKLKPLGPGAYAVKWSVVAEDGHHTEGSYNFSVAAAAAKTP